jgi:formylglycine-generating enzyme required for sulfatase activity
MRILSILLSILALSLLPLVAQPPLDSLELVQEIRAKIVAQAEKEKKAVGKDYASKVPETGAPYAMIALEGGQFTMGSPKDEPNRQDDEGPTRKVAIDPFWMGKNEVTWDEYEPFMITSVSRKKDGKPSEVPEDAELNYVVSKPTTPYTEMSFGMGTKGYPAISMTQHAALKYCQWLSSQTGHFYRLPTEAEWEYACRAGTTTAYSWGDDPEKADDYAWHWGNCDGQYQPVGEKKPNPWDLHDMHGNVIEWTLDAYAPYQASEGVVDNPCVRPDKNLYPRVARGGSWYDEPDLLRSAARFQSSSDWKIQDPQLPKSIWYHTNAMWLGFRLVRPVEIPSAEEMHRIWNSGRGIENDE